MRARARYIPHTLYPRVPRSEEPFTKKGPRPRAGAAPPVRLRAFAHVPPPARLTKLIAFVCGTRIAPARVHVLRVPRVGAAAVLGLFPGRHGACLLGGAAFGAASVLLFGSLARPSSPACGRGPARVSSFGSVALGVRLSACEGGWTVLIAERVPRSIIWNVSFNGELVGTIVRSSDKWTGVTVKWAFAAGLVGRGIIPHIHKAMTRLASRVQNVRSRDTHVVEQELI